MTPSPAAAERDAVVLTEGQMRAWGRRLGPAAARWDGLVALTGPLGSGKSTLVRAAARACGVEGPVQSPTYTLVHEHPLPGGATLFHVDLYRIRDPGELAGLGWERILSLPGPVFVEWADRAPGQLPDRRWEVQLAMAGEVHLRRARIGARGDAPRPPRPREPKEEG